MRKSIFILLLCLSFNARAQTAIQLPQYNPNTFYNYFDHQIKFPFAPGENLTAYTPHVIRLGTSDSLIAAIKSDGTRALYSYLSTNNGETFTWVDTISWRGTNIQHNNDVQEGTLVYGDDSIRCFFNGVASGTQQWNAVWYTASPRNNPFKFYESPSPWYDTGAFRRDFSSIPSYLSICDVIQKGDSIYMGLVAALKDSGDKYRGYLLAGTNFFNMRGVARIVEPNPPFGDSYSFSMYRDDDSLWYMTFTQGDINNGQVYHIKSKWALHPAGPWNELPGMYDELVPDSTWEYKRKYGQSFLKDNTNLGRLDTKHGYAQSYYSASFELLDRAGRSKLYPHTSKNDTDRKYVSMSIRDFNIKGVKRWLDSNSFNIATAKVLYGTDTLVGLGRTYLGGRQARGNEYKTALNGFNFIDSARIGGILYIGGTLSRIRGDIAGNYGMNLYGDGAIYDFYLSGSAYDIARIDHGSDIFRFLQRTAITNVPAYSTGGKSYLVHNSTSTVIEKVSAIPFTDVTGAQDTFNKKVTKGGDAGAFSIGTTNASTMYVVQKGDTAGMIYGDAGGTYKSIAFGAKNKDGYLGISGNIGGNFFVQNSKPYTSGTPGMGVIEGQQMKSDSSGYMGVWRMVPRNYGNGTSLFGGFDIQFRNGSGYNNLITANPTTPVLTFANLPVSFGTAVTMAGGLAMSSTTSGFLPPRMTTAQRTALTLVEGLTVYDTDIHKLYVYDGTVWQAAW